jgi:hypothetical protein
MTVAYKLLRRQDSPPKVNTVLTEYVTDLNELSKMIIFESILITFESSVVLKGSWGSSVNWLELKTKPP